MILIYDTETTGFVNTREPPSHPSQPKLVQLACLLYEEDGTEVQSVSLIVKPDGWTIPPDAAKVHGITTEMAMKQGVPLRVALACFTNLRAVSSLIGAHNFEFDDLVMKAALAQVKAIPSHPGPKENVCTMRASTDYCKLPGSARMKAAGMDGFKPPKLEELYSMLFKKSLANTHNALADARGCAECYFELKKRKVIL